MKIAEVNNELRVTKIPSLKITEPESNVDFNETYFKVGLLFFLLLITALIFVFFKKKPKNKVKAA